MNDRIVPLADVPVRLRLPDRAGSAEGAFSPDPLNTLAPAALVEAISKVFDRKFR
jgi:hypothetical protein